MNSRRITLSVAAALALGTGILTFNYLSAVGRQNAAVEPPRSVLIATRDIAARSPILPEMLRRVERPASSVEPDAVTSASAVAGTIALITIPNGSTIANSKIGRPSEAGLPVRLHPGMRAVSIGIDRVKGVSGLVTPGDKVDVIAIVARMANEEPRAMTIMRGATVLAIGNTIERLGATPVPESASLTTVTLEVTPQQADIVTLADVNATLRLALRSPRESNRSEPVAPLRFPVQHMDAPRNIPMPVAPAPAPLMAPPAQPVVLPAAVPAKVAKVKPAVTVIDGDRVVEGGNAPKPAE